MSVSPVNELQEFLIGFTHLNKLTVESRCICMAIGSENDCPELREKLVVLQFLMIREIEVNRRQLMQCWQIGNSEVNNEITSKDSDRMYAAFTSLVDYHMRALLKCLYLFNLFPTADADANFIDPTVVRANTARSISDCVKSSLCALVTTGMSELPDLRSFVEANAQETMDMDINPDMTEREVLKGQYMALKELLNEVSSLMGVAPWTIAFHQDDSTLRSSLKTFQTETGSLSTYRKDSLSGKTTETILKIPGVTGDAAPVGSKQRVKSLTVSIHEDAVQASIQRAKRMNPVLYYLKRRQALTLIMCGSTLVMGVAAVLVILMIVIPNSNR
ncbi:unnamed protein product [Calicophoron daubneyi]|uniref:Uncharacterized protein n=1 Tax=Calicophoron daubneyi TaxID=300641 RepID=A0AAV2TEL7_CALDB